MSYTSNALYAQSPYTAVVYITYTNASGQAYQASGVLIAPNIVLTAGHVTDAATVGSIRVTPDQYGSVKPYGTATAAATTWLSGAPQPGFLDEAQTGADLGLIALSSDVGTQTGWMNLDVLYQGGSVTTAGYPGTAAGVQQVAQLATTAVNSNHALQYASGTVSAGSSGSPLWTMVDGQAEVVGIVSTNIWAAQITPADVSFIAAFEAAHPASGTSTASATGTGTTGTSATGTVTALAGASSAGLMVKAGAIVTSTSLLTDQNNPVLKGSAGANASLRFTLDGTAIGTAQAGADGSWSYGLSGLGVGAHTLAITDTLGDAASVKIQNLSSPANGVSTASMNSVDLAALLDSGAHVQAAAGTQSIAFLDGSLNMGSGTDAAYIARLYEGLLGRAPDSGGLGAMADALASGQSRTALAAGIMGSAEYSTAHGGDSDSQFVQMLYGNLLGRAPSAAETNGWVGTLQAGGDRAAMATAIAGSAESQSHWQAMTTDLWVPDANAALIYREYVAALHRTPSVGEMQSWIADLHQGMSQLTVSTGLASAPEFLALHAGQSDADFITDLYQNALQRTPDAGGLQFWENSLSSGAAIRSTLLLSMAQTPEMVARLSHSF